MPNTLYRQAAFISIIVVALMAAACSTGKTSASTSTTVGGSVKGTWTASLPTDLVGGLTDVSCSSPNNCIAVGGDGTGAGRAIGSTDGGVTWIASPLPDAMGTLFGVACLSNGNCIAVGNYSGVLRGTLGGSWTSVVVTGVTNLADVSCAALLDCLAVGNGIGGGPIAISSTDGGATWTTLPPPSGVQQFSSVRCTTPTMCLATGTNDGNGQILRTTDGGSAWSAQAAPGKMTPTGTSCWNGGSDCVVVGSPSNVCSESGPVNCANAGAAYSTDGGISWTLSATGSEGGGVACPAAGECFAPAGSGIEASSDGGRTWNPQMIPSSPSGLAALAAVSCTATSNCVAVGGYRSSPMTASIVHYSAPS